MAVGDRTDMLGMDALQPFQPDPNPKWSTRLIPLREAAVETDVVVTHSASRLLTARSRVAYPSGLPVRIDQFDSALLGEVIACREETPGEFALLIELNESLSGLHNLRNLMNSLMGAVAVTGHDRDTQKAVARRRGRDAQARTNAKRS